METGGQKCHVILILTNQQAAWWCNALQLPSEKMLRNPSIAVIQYSRCFARKFWQLEGMIVLGKYFNRSVHMLIG